MDLPNIDFEEELFGVMATAALLRCKQTDSQKPLENDENDGEIDDNDIENDDNDDDDDDNEDDDSDPPPPPEPFRKFNFCHDVIV